MNMTDLKTLFYKRYCAVPKKLISVSAGIPAAFLGYTHTSYMPAISTCLSPSVTMLASKTEDFNVTFASTLTDQRRRYSVIHPAQNDIIARFISLTKPEIGCEILADCSIPPSFDAHIPYAAAALMSLEKSLNTPLPGGIEAFYKNECNAYRTIYSHLHGCATCILPTGSENLALPLLSHKILLAGVNKKSRGFTQKSIERLFYKIQKTYPHISSFSDICGKMPEKLRLDTKESALIQHLIYECSLIESGKNALKNADLDGFLQTINKSFISQKQVFLKSDARIFLCDTLLKSGKVLCARISDAGVIAIVSDKYCDCAVNDMGAAFLSEFGYEPSICITETH